jgi:hypothetical protein
MTDDCPEPTRTLRVTLKNPSSALADDFAVEILEDMSLGHLKEKIEAEYPGNPAPGDMTVRV